jgi:hypothetical protein
MHGFFALPSRPLQAQAGDIERLVNRFLEEEQPLAVAPDAALSGVVNKPWAKSIASMPMPSMISGSWS